MPSWRGLNLNQLRFVQAVAETRTFTAGAERCYVTQSTLSSGIAQLERELGAPLFVRASRAATLTPFGRRLLPLMEAMLQAQAALVAAADDYLDPDVKQVRIGICPLVDLARIDCVLTPYREAYRSAQIVFEQLSGLDPRVALHERRFDFLLGPSEIKHATIERAHLYDDELVYLAAGCAPAPEGQAPPVALRDVAGDTFVLVHERCGLTVRTRQLFRTRRLALHQYQTRAVAFSVLEEWAQLGIASAILPRSKVSTPGLGQRILLGGGHATIRFEAAWSPAHAVAPHLQALAAYLEGTIGRA